MKIDIKEITLELEINCSRDHAWNVLLNRISDWWPSDFLCLPGARQIKLETWAGGRLYEETEAGAQLLWSNVAVLQPGECLELVGPVSPSFGGPGMNFTRLTLTDGAEGKTVFRMQNTVFGNTSNESQESVEQGWGYLFGKLKDFCEKA